VKLLRFADPQPQRSIGLAWRRTSSRKADFIALGRIVVATLKVESVKARMPTAPDAIAHAIAT
jgi:LysR family transcriptional regulator, hydrogen peroxide-inducible genes activator